MNGKRLYDIKFNKDHTSYDEIIGYGLGERIRDIEFYPNGNYYILVLESTPVTKEFLEIINIFFFFSINCLSII